MADLELRTDTPQRADAAPRPRIRSRTVEGLRAYGLIVAMWVRSTMAYRASFVMTTIGNLAASGLDFVGILLMFSHIKALGGFTLPEVALLYGTTSASLGLADLLIGSMDRVGQRVRDGSFDVLLVRPVPVCVQIAADRFALRRIGRILQGLLVLGWGLPRVPVQWTPLHVAMVPLMVVCGATIFASLFIAGAAFQLWAGDASEVQNSFIYGGSTLLQYPPGIFAKELVRGVTFVVPLAFVNWLPVLHLLGRPDPLHLPGWVAFLSPVPALLAVTAAGLLWRAALRSYRSTGS